MDANFVNSNNPWVMRGGNYNNGAVAGAFDFSNHNGRAYADNSARAVLLGAGALDYTIRRDPCYYLDNIKFHISNYLYNFGS